jgi:hypothetical protein
MLRLAGQGVLARAGALAIMAVMVCFLASVKTTQAEQGFSIGYGLAAFMDGKHAGKVAGGNYYDFIRATYLYEKPFTGEKLALAIEPFASYVSRPADGADAGLTLGLKYYPYRTGKGGFYFTGGPGIAYTTIGFKEQGTHLLFIVQGGFGYRYKNLFIENRISHWSNAHTASPNWSVNSNILAIGTNF